MGGKKGASEWAPASRFFATDPAGTPTMTHPESPACRGHALLPVQQGRPAGEGRLLLMRRLQERGARTLPRGGRRPAAQQQPGRALVLHTVRAAAHAASLRAQGEPEGQMLSQARRPAWGSPGARFQSGPLPSVLGAGGKRVAPQQARWLDRAAAGAAGHGSARVRPRAGGGQPAQPRRPAAGADGARQAAGEFGGDRAGGQAVWRQDPRQPQEGAQGDALWVEGLGAGGHSAATAVNWTTPECRCCCKHPGRPAWNGPAATTRAGCALCLFETQQLLRRGLQRSPGCSTAGHARHPQQLLPLL